MNIQQLLSTEDGSKITLAVTALQLKEFGLSLINEARLMAAEDMRREAEAQDRLLKSREVCKRLCVTLGTLANWRKAKKLLPVKMVEGQYLYRQADVEEFSRYYDVRGAKEAAV